MVTDQQAFDKHEQPTTQGMMLRQQAQLQSLYEDGAGGKGFV